jgi:hypothetical protein
MASEWIDTLSEQLDRYALQTGLSTTQLGVSIGLGVVAIAGVGAYLSKGSSRSNHGPGPKGMPILGNAADLPKEDDFKVYADWAK